MGNQNSVDEKYYILDDEKIIESLKNNNSVINDIIKTQSVNILVHLSKDYKIKTIIFILEELKKEIVFYNNRNNILISCFNNFLLNSYLDISNYIINNLDVFSSERINFICNIAFIIKYTGNLCNENPCNISNINKILDNLLRNVIIVCYTDKTVENNFELYIDNICDYYKDNMHNKLLKKKDLKVFLNIITDNTKIVNILFKKYVKKYNITSITQCLDLIFDNSRNYNIIINHNFEENKTNINNKDNVDIKQKNLEKIKLVIQQNSYISSVIFDKCLKYNNYDILNIYDLNKKYLKNEIQKNILEKEQFIKILNENNLLK